MDKKLKSANIAVIGLGYVGLPLAVEFSKKYPVKGFDIDRTRIDELKNNFDRTNEIAQEILEESTDLKLTFSKADIADSNIYIVTVPTPVDKANVPDLTAKEVKEYIRYIADRRLLQLGMKKIFHSTENPLPWIDMQVNAVEHTNFFENRATEYAKSSTQGNWQDIFK